MIPSSVKVQTNPPPLNEPVAGSESGSATKKISERSPDKEADLGFGSIAQNRAASLDNLGKKEFSQVEDVDGSERALLNRIASMGSLDHKTSGFVASSSSEYKDLHQTTSEESLVASSEYKDLHRTTSEESLVASSEDKPLNWSTREDNQDNEILDQATGAESIVTKQSASDLSTARSAFVLRSDVSSKPPRRMIQKTSEDQPKARKRDQLKGAVDDAKSGLKALFSRDKTK